ncbi:unnamed protein product [Caenorhabditis auriculariae]|uniref:G-protein coupled receptors family 1 profile domain-containing protein n=1 Tax=Caenorhabditis auriculariae TaxID=2777116 RepID=A0A8S1HX28_9PELO|nr:unnamed protein product [Caenorhabditis auriculariae]
MDLFDVIAFIFHAVAGILGLAFNCIFIALIATKTTRLLKPYWILLFNVAVTDLVLCTSLGLIMTRMVVIGDSLAYIFHGPFKYIGPKTCFITHCIMLHGIIHCITLTIISFGYRLFVLKHPSPSSRTLWIIIALCYFPTFLMLVIVTYTLETDPAVIENMAKQRNDIDWASVSHVFVKSSITTAQGICTTYSFIITTIGVFSVIFMRRKAHSILKRADDSMSATTKRIHKTLMKALAIQASLPLLMYIAEVAFLYLYILQVHSSLVENLVFQFSMLPPVLSPIMSIYYVQPYRILLFNVALTDFVSSAALGVVMSRLLVIGDNLAYIFHGPGKYFGTKLCFLAHSIMLHGLIHCITLTIISFGYRLFVLRHSSPSSRNLWLIILLGYFPSFLMFVTFMCSLETDTRVIETLKKQRSDIDWNVVSHVFLTSVYAIPLGSCSFYLFIVTTAGCFSVILIRRKANSILQSADNSLSATTKRVHKTLMKALAVQASLPFLMYIADLNFSYLCLFQVHSSPIENSVLMLSMVPPALSPVMSIYYVRPYRVGLQEWAKKLFGVSSKFGRKPIYSINALSTVNPGISRSFASEM